MNAPLIDSHCHLDFADFGAERAAVLERGRAEGIAWFVTIGSGRGAESAPDAVALAHEHADVVATVGIHPHDAKLVTDAAFAAVEALADDARVVAVGEVGLDFHYDLSPRDAQRAALRRFVALARRVKKPLVIHTRAAPDETLAVLREEGARDVGGVIHCFTEDAAFARAAMDLGFDISFSGIVTFKKSEDLRAAARTVPLDRMLIETDSPYLAPIPLRGKTNEPSYVVHTAKRVAELRGVSVDELCRLTTENARRRLGLRSGAPGA